MKKALSLIMVFLVVAAFSATGHSAEKYVSLGGGISWINDTELTDIAGIVEDVLEGEVELDTGSGLTGIAAFGCDYGDYRIEGEIGYQSGDINGIGVDFSKVVGIHEDLVLIGEDLNADPPILEDITVGDMFGDGTWESGDVLEGDVTVYSLMVNGYYDIDLGGVELSPYVGVGVAQVNFEDVRYSGFSEIEVHPFDLLGELNLDDHETTLAYQAGAVVGIPVADNIMFDLRYRYFSTTELTTLAFINTSLSSHSAMGGLRVSF